MRLVMTAAAATAVLLAAGCTAGGSHDAAAPGRSPAPLPADPRTGASLLKIATAFNDEYQRRLRARLRPLGCPQPGRHPPGGVRPPQSGVPQRTAAACQHEGDAPGQHGAWIVSYEIGGQQLTDYWFYANRRWVFDLVRTLVPMYR